MILLITYNKGNILKNYNGLHNAIKSAGTWWHHLDNTWMIHTDKNPTYWYNKFVPHLAEGDRILIIEVTPNYQGWLKKDGWEWLLKQFRKDGYNL